MILMNKVMTRVMIIISLKMIESTLTTLTEMIFLNINKDS
jgi:hypothetical protein